MRSGRRSTSCFARPAAIKLIARARHAGGIGPHRRGALPAGGGGGRRAPIAAHHPALRLRHHPRPPALLRHGAARGNRPRVARRPLRTPAARPGGVTSSARRAIRWPRPTPRGLVHRDIKPANLHIGRIGLEYDFVKVLDFGLVKQDGRWLREDVRLTAPESMSGTPAYMAPEMAAGEAVDGRADLYALGCVGYFLLTGSLVFEAENALQLVLKHIQAEPVAPSVRLGAPVPDALERADPELSGQGPRRPPRRRRDPGATRSPAPVRTIGPRAMPGGGGRPPSPRGPAASRESRHPPSFSRWPRRTEWLRLAVMTWRSKRRDVLARYSAEIQDRLPYAASLRADPLISGEVGRVGRPGRGDGGEGAVVEDHVRREAPAPGLLGPPRLQAGEQLGIDVALVGSPPPRR